MIISVLLTLRNFASRADFRPGWPILCERKGRVETWRGDDESFRFHVPLIEPDRRISRIRLSDQVHTCLPTGRARRSLRFDVQRLLQLLNRFRRS